MYWPNPAPRREHDLAARERADLAARERAVLGALASNHGEKMRDGDGWSRPMDVGGRDGSHHCATLRRLVDLGLAERRLRFSLMNQISGGDTGVQRTSRRATRRRGSYVYRASELGLLMWAAISDQKPKRKRGRR